MKLFQFHHTDSLESILTGLVAITRNCSCFTLILDGEYIDSYCTSTLLKVVFRYLDDNRNIKVYSIIYN